MNTVQPEQLILPETIIPEYLIQPGDGQNSQLSSQLDSVSGANTTSASQRLSLITKQQAVVAISIVLAATYTTQAEINRHPTPAYEGKFQITVAPARLATYPVETPQIEDINQNLEVGRPKLDYETQIEVLKTPRVINPVITRLQAQGVTIDYQSLVKNLRVTHHGNSETIEVSYHGTDSQTVQRILTQVAQAYLQEGQNCQTSACQGVQFIEAQLPQLRQKVNNLRIKLQEFQQQYGEIDPEAQGQLLAYYTATTAKQEAEMEAKLNQFRDQQKSLQELLAIESDPTIMTNLLNRDPSYRLLISQIQAVETRMINKFSRLPPSNNNLGALDEMYQKLLTQLYHQTQLILVDQASNQMLGLQDSWLKQPIQQERLQQWLNTTCYLQVLEMRQQTITKVRKQLEQQVGQWAARSKRYAEIRQGLQAATIHLNEYLARKQILQAQSDVQEVTWSIAPPEIHSQSTWWSNSNFLNFTV
jgi:uncharacterized protein involved in exopolysaccharide biosynthesis